MIYLDTRHLTEQTSVFGNPGCFECSNTFVRIIHVLENSDYGMILRKSLVFTCIWLLYVVLKHFSILLMFYRMKNKVVDCAGNVTLIRQSCYPNY